MEVRRQHNTTPGERLYGHRHARAAGVRWLAARRSTLGRLRDCQTGGPACGLACARRHHHCVLRLTTLPAPASLGGVHLSSLEALASSEGHPWDTPRSIL